MPNEVIKLGRGFRISKGKVHNANPHAYYSDHSRLLQITWKSALPNGIDNAIVIERKAAIELRDYLNLVLKDD